MRPSSGPRTYHLDCLNLERAPRGLFSCPQHVCSACDRKAHEAGGLLVSLLDAHKTVTLCLHCSRLVLFVGCLRALHSRVWVCGPLWHLKISRLGLVLPALLPLPLCFLSNRFSWRSHSCLLNFPPQFRCVVCPCAYCEDHVPDEHEGRIDLGRPRRHSFCNLQRLTHR